MGLKYSLEKNFLSAVGNNDIATVEKFLQNEVDVEVSLQRNSPICISIEKGHLEMTAELLFRKGFGISQCHCHGMTPLHVAAAHGHIPLAKLLVEKGADVNAAAANSHSPLHFAVTYQNPEMVKLLVEVGGDMNQRSREGWTPFHEACWKQDAAVVEYLISKGADVNTENNNGDTPLMTVLEDYDPYDDDLKIISMLIEAGTKLNHRNCHGHTPLTMAIARSSELSPAVELLLRSGCDINLCGPSGLSPLCMAVKCRKDEIAKVLIHAGCDVNIMDNEGFSPLHYATLERGSHGLARLLVAAGARPIHPDSIREELREMNEWDEELRLWLISMFHSVPTLQEQCRIAIRRSLGLWADEKIKNLKLPEALEKFLCFKDLEESSLN